MQVRLSTEKRQVQIADAALQIIAEQGLSRFTTAEIARRVGIAEGTLFRHFDSKEAIVSAAIARLEDLLGEATFPPVDDPIDRLGTFFSVRLTILTTRPGVERLLFSDQLLAAAGEEGVQRVRELRRRSTRFIRQCLTEASEKGLMAMPDGIDELVVLVMGAMLALFHANEILPGELSVDERARRVWSTLTSILRK